MDNKRVLLAFALSFAVILAFRWAFPPATEPVNPPATTPPPAAANVPATAPPSAPAPKTATPAAVIPQELHADVARGTEFETSLYKATIYNEGGVLKSFLLKTKYLDAAGRPLEMINGVSAASVGWPLAISTGDSKLDSFLSHAVYAVKSEGNKISLEFAGDGIYSRKDLEFDPENYQFKLTTTLQRNGQPVPHEILWQAVLAISPFPTNRRKSTPFTKRIRRSIEVSCCPE
jgi:YidC/Oxa1 family membrane protein insertase